ncbi:MAG: VanZ family protein [Jejuia sp.]
MLKRYSLFLAVPYTLALLCASLMSLKDMPEVDVNHGDKIFHFLAYAILSFLWYFVFYFKMSQTSKRAILYAVFLAVVFGIIIEVLQGTLTTYRAFDVYDAIANSLGALLTGIVLWVKAKLQVKN